MLPIVGDRYDHPEILQWLTLVKWPVPVLLSTKIFANRMTLKKDKCLEVFDVKLDGGLHGETPCKLGFFPKPYSIISRNCLHVSSKKAPNQDVKRSHLVHAAHQYTTSLPEAITLLSQSRFLTCTSPCPAKGCLALLLNARGTCFKLTTYHCCIQRISLSNIASKTL